ncbi:hypothetical protein Hanom_Chr12g01082301 [Helianthus anomalus]
MSWWFGSCEKKGCCGVDQASEGCWCEHWLQYPCTLHCHRRLGQGKKPERCRVHGAPSVF